MTTHHPPSETVPDHFHTPAYWSSKAIMPGIYAISPMLPGTIAFGMAFGALCAQKNFTLTRSAGDDGLRLRRLSQFVAVSSWPDQLTVSSIATLALLTLTVYIRFSLMSASLRPWFGTLPPWQSYPSMLLVTDGGWLAATRYSTHGGADASFFVGGGIVLYIVWFVSSLPGYLLAGQLSDPKKYGVDLVVPAFYAAMLVPAWKGPRLAIPWAVAGVVALIVHWLVPGWWFIIAGAVSGAISAGLMERSRPPPVRIQSGRGGRMSEFFRSDVMIALAVMMAVTVASRLGGYWLMGYVIITPRVRPDARRVARIGSSSRPRCRLRSTAARSCCSRLAPRSPLPSIRRNEFVAVITGMAVAALARAMVVHRIKLESPSSDEVKIRAFRRVFNQLYAALRI